jgi:hypothetical protein
MYILVYMNAPFLTHNGFQQEEDAYRTHESWNAVRDEVVSAQEWLTEQSSTNVTLHTPRPPPAPSPPLSFSELSGLVSPPCVHLQRAGEGVPSVCKNKFRPRNTIYVYVNGCTSTDKFGKIQI